MCIIKNHGLHGKYHHKEEISVDVTVTGQTNKGTREDSATQPMKAGWMSFAICIVLQNDTSGVAVP